MPSRLDLSCVDLAALFRRGLGERVQEVHCHTVDHAVHFSLTGLDVSNWLPRLRVEIAVTPSLNTERQEMMLHWRTVPSSLTGILAGPAQQLGVGSKVVDALVDRLHWREAVVSRDNDVVVFALQRLFSLQRLGIRVAAIAIAQTVQVELQVEDEN